MKQPETQTLDLDESKAKIMESWLSLEVFSRIIAGSLQSSNC